MAKKGKLRHVKRNQTAASKDRSANPTSLTYAQSLEAIAIVRPTRIVGLPVENTPYPNSPVDAIIQAKLCTVNMVIAAIGRLPGDFPPDRFDRPVKYRKLEPESLVWLEARGMAPRRNWGPLAGTSLATYVGLFGLEDRLPVSGNKINYFFSRLTDCLLTEAKMTLTRQYYYGLGLDKPDVPLSLLYEGLPTEVTEAIQLSRLNGAALDQLHGMIFLDYFSVLLRAQWDKLVHLSCLVFDLKDDWDSVSKGLDLLEGKLNRNDNQLDSWCQHHLRLFTEIARDRTKDGGWLKGYRDRLVHFVAWHSADVLPHKNSLETTSEVWNNACDEHDWLREAMMTAFIAFTSAKTIPKSE